MEKNTALIARAKVTKIIESIQADRLPEGQKAMSAGILIDKAQLLDGEPTEIVEHTGVDLDVNILNLINKSDL